MVLPASLCYIQTGETLAMWVFRCKLDLLSGFLAFPVCQRVRYKFFQPIELNLFCTWC